MQEDKPFRGLQQFGTAFLQRLECSQCPCDILESVTFVDTPGVLSGEKQRIGRAYDFVKVVDWFAQKSGALVDVAVCLCVNVLISVSVCQCAGLCASV